MKRLPDFAQLLLADRPKRSIAFDVIILAVLAAIAFAHLQRQRPYKRQTVSAAGQRISARVADVFDPPLSAWIAGLLIGDDSGFSPKWKEIFRRTGTAHLTAVSGANVAALTSFLGVVFGRFFSDRRARLAANSAAVAGFVLLTGAPASVLRAALMYSSEELARNFFGRPVKRLRALLLSVLALTLIKPSILTNDRGFQLSVLATFGLAAFSEPLSATVFRRLPKTLRSWASQTAAATLATAPLIAWMSGRYSLVTLAANLAVAPFIAPAMAVGALIVSLSSVSLPLARLAADLLRPVMAAPLVFLRALSALPLASIAGIPASVALITVTLLAGWALLRWWRRVGERHFLYVEEDGN